MSLRNSYPGIHFKDPWLMEPHTNAAGNLRLYNATPSSVASNTTAFFTGFAQFGVQDNTDWTSNTYKTIYSHTGKGLIYGMVACTAGGAETTTFEITIDGVLTTITVTNANGERAALMINHSNANAGDEFTTALAFAQPVAGVSLDSSSLSTFQTGLKHFVPLKFINDVGVSALRYDISCLIRMKHSASITNSTATAFSGVLVRKGIAA